MIALLSRQPIYSLSPPPESRVARPQAVSVLPLDSAPAFFSFFIAIQQSSFPLGTKGALTDTLRMSYQCFASSPYLASLIMCRNRKSGKQDIPDVYIWYRFAYLARMLLDCHTSSGSTLAATADL